MKSKFNFKICKVIKFTLKTIFNHVLLTITFNDKFWRSKLNILHLSIEHNNKSHNNQKSDLNNTLLIILGLWPKKMVLIYQSTILVHFTMLAPICVCSWAIYLIKF